MPKYAPAVRLEGMGRLKYSVGKGYRDNAYVMDKWMEIKNPSKMEGVLSKRVGVGSR